MATAIRPPANAFVAHARKIYHPIGFSKGYNFTLWFIFLGAFFGFLLARLEYLNFFGVFCGGGSGGSGGGDTGALPGECFYYLRPRSRYQVGIILHLACILPAGLLACLQFVPVVRRRFALLHRVNGYAVLLLSLLGTAGALMIADRAFGGSLETRAFVGVLAVAFLGSLAMAVVNIKRLQIEQHRIWMLRAWFYAGVIITMRLILIVGAGVVTAIEGFTFIEPCDKIDWTLGGQNATLAAYPGCAPLYTGEDPHQQVIVDANFNGTLMEVVAALNLVFGMAGWIAIFLHAVGIEIYIRLTPAEHERLRKISYQRQLAAGMRHPGRAGLTVDRLGDAEKWAPPVDDADPDGRDSLAKPADVEQSSHENDP
ncbi:hypothetical protein GGR56DRAFT_694969 [Xylariaceae sp. FL0804]|nr:hypothetical protein GGR56DRAFT_694969 [Xylariaceae sp. FL0804]